MNEYRIAQISEHEFIPQVRLQNKNKIFEWYGITTNDLLVINNTEVQLKFCVVSTLKEAKSIIKFYQRKMQSSYPIYHTP